ncbi:DUF4149 domain-containing protein [Pseudomonas sp. N040]|uniref:DUF4149 domain-containing protein n=1 Tax=Pseudomonas sp. N040 TaxID=2785325 RepID=UPI0018A30DDD|nr:DUF4149 domain-containing protein [Pseudomonas sp. N040]MBF7729537.1 DUF4149 domain-containing protein [Pseudomonas sp. N040]MBW7013177.1 DUF4149 domain-containing protein [Pseudomonas sp. N040]
MSRSVIFKQPPGAAFISWQLAQTFWVGGLWLLHFVLLPALGKYGLAPLLVSEVGRALSSLLVGFAAFCALLQLLVLVQVARPFSIWRDTRGQLLLSVLVLAVAYFAVSQWLPEAQRWLLFNYLVLAFCGLLLVLQPIPGAGAEPGSGLR